MMNTIAPPTRTRLGSFITERIPHMTEQAVKWFAWKLFKLFAFIVALLLVAFLATNAWIAYNGVRTNYTVDEPTEGVYVHSDDQMTTDIINWLTGEVSVPESIRLPLYRQYVKTVREDAEMEIPENFPTLGYQELRELAVEWYLQNYPNATGTEEEIADIITGLFNEAVRPPLEGFGPNVNERVWMVMRDVGAPRVRLVAEQDEYPSRIMAASAARGDEQAFYYPPEHTIYIRYNDSVKVLLNEASHPWQFTEHRYSSYWRLFGSLAESFMAGVVRNANDYYAGEYDNPEALEGEAHGTLRDELLQRHGLSIVFETAPDMLAPQHVCIVPDPLELETE